MSHNFTGYTDDMNPDMIDGASGPSQSRTPRRTPRRRSGRRRSSAAWTPAASSITIPPAIWARCTPAISTRTWPPFRKSATGSSIGPPRASSRCLPANTARRAPGTGPCTAAGTKANANGAASPCPGSSATPSGTAQFLGDRAFQISDAEKTEPPLGGQAVPRRQNLASLGLSHAIGLARADRSASPIFAMYLGDNWRAFRTWGMSANSPWEHRPLLERCARTWTRAARISRSIGKTSSGPA